MWSNVINMKANAVSSEHLSGNSLDTPFGKIGLFSMPNAVSELMTAILQFFKDNVSNHVVML